MERKSLPIKVIAPTDDVPLVEVEVEHEADVADEGEEDHQPHAQHDRLLRVRLGHGHLSIMKRQLTRS